MHLNPDDPDTQHFDKLDGLSNSNAINLTQKGCFLTSYSMALSALGYNETPGTVYEKLRDNAGITAVRPKTSGGKGVRKFNSKGIPSFDGIDTMHTRLNNLDFEGPGLDFRTREVRSEDEIAKSLDDGNVALLNINNGGHWVAAVDYEYDGSEYKFKIIDPGRSNGSRDGLFSLKEKKFKKARLVEAESIPSNQGVVQTNSPVEFLMTSPSGERVGYDPATGIFYDEMVLSSYAPEYPILDPDESYTDEELGVMSTSLPHVAFLNYIEMGDYNIDVVGMEDGHYGLSFAWRSESGSTSNFEVEGTITAGEVVSYVVTIEEPDDVLGDHNGNGHLDAGDLNLQAEAMLSGSHPAEFDLTGDTLVDAADRLMWLHDLKGAFVGDSDLDGEFNTLDFVEVFQDGLYETGQPTGWAEGDWDGNLLFDTLDFVAAFTDGGYERGPYVGEANAVPEPSSWLLLMFAALGVVAVRCRSLG